MAAIFADDFITDLLLSLVVEYFFVNSKLRQKYRGSFCDIVDKGQFFRANLYNTCWRHQQSITFIRRRRSDSGLLPQTV